MHQPKALCPNLEHLENIYCATQLCSRLDGLVVQICRQLSLDCTQRQPLFLQVVCEHESASVPGTVGHHPPLCVIQGPPTKMLSCREISRSGFGCCFFRKPSLFKATVPENMPGLPGDFT